MEGTGKLVRDRVPELIIAKGEQPRTRVARGEEYPALLRLKLLEEVQEFLDSDDADELVDVIEVVYALARHKGVEPERLEELREIKERERGGFRTKTVLIATEGPAAPAEPPVVPAAPAPAPRPATPPPPQPTAVSGPNPALERPAAPSSPQVPPTSLFFNPRTSGGSGAAPQSGTVYRSGSVTPGNGSREVTGPAS